MKGKRKKIKAKDLLPHPLCQALTFGFYIIPFR